MHRVGKKGNVILPVMVAESTPKQMRAGAKQYIAAPARGELFRNQGDGWFTMAAGEGDSIEEAVDAVSEQL